MWAVPCLTLVKLDLLCVKVSHAYREPPQIWVRTMMQILLFPFSENMDKGRVIDRIGQVIDVE